MPLKRFPQYIGPLFQSSIQTRSTIRARPPLTNTPFFLVRTIVDSGPSIFAACSSSNARALLVTAHHDVSAVAETHTEALSLILFAVFGANSIAARAPTTGKFVWYQARKRLNAMRCLTKVPLRRSPSPRKFTQHICVFAAARRVINDLNSYAYMNLEALTLLFCR